MLKSARIPCRVYRADCALLYRVCGWWSTTTCSYIFQKRPHKIKGFGDEGCCKKNDETHLLLGKWQKKALITERPTMFQLSPLSKEKDYSKKTYTYCPFSSVCPTCFRLITFEIRRIARHAKHTHHQGWANIFRCSSFFLSATVKSRKLQVVKDVIMAKSANVYKTTNISRNIVPIKRTKIRSPAYRKGIVWKPWFQHLLDGKREKIEI